MLGLGVAPISSEHREMVEMLKIHDSKEAGKLLYEHLERVKIKMKTLLAERENSLVANAIAYNNIMMAQ